MAGEPNELPEGGEGGGSFGGFRPRPSPELPPDFLNRNRSGALLGEIVRLRNRLHQFETQQLIAAVSGRRITGFNPAELPIPEGGEGGGGGGGGGVIPGVFPGENPAELPAFDEAARLQITHLTNRLAGFENRVVEMLGAVQKQLETLKKTGLK